MNNLVKQLQDSFERQIDKREEPVLRLAYIVRPRQLVEHGWNWCNACYVEVLVRHAHNCPTECSSCHRRFIEVHEAAEANERLRRDPSYSGPYHDILSAAYHEWSLRLVVGEPLPDGSLAYDVKPFELPHENVFVGTRTLSRRERRQRARRGYRGRRGARSVDDKENVYVREPFEPDVWREQQPLSAPWIVGKQTKPRTRAMLDVCVSEYRRTRYVIKARACEYCGCSITTILTLYAEHDVPHVRQPIERNMRHAASTFAVLMRERGLCFCTGLKR